MFKSFFNYDTAVIESDLEYMESSDSITNTADIKVEGIENVEVFLDSSAVIASLALMNYQVEVNENLGLVTYSIDGFFTLSNSMYVNIDTPSIISIMEIV